MSKFGAIGLRPCQSAVNTTRKPNRGLATVRVKIWCDRAATVSKCCKYHTKTEQGFSNCGVKIWCDRAATLSKCCRYGLRLSLSAVNTTRKPSRGLATVRVKIWCDRAATQSKCCKYHTKTEQAFSSSAWKNVANVYCVNTDWLSLK